MGLLGIGSMLSNLWEKVRVSQEFHSLESYLRLFIEWAFTSVIGFCGVTGPLLMLKPGTSRAIGAGLSAIALGSLQLYLRTPLAKNLMIAVPQSVVKELEDNPDETVISGPDAEKK